VPRRCASYRLRRQCSGERSVHEYKVLETHRATHPVVAAQPADDGHSPTSGISAVDSPTCVGEGLIVVRLRAAPDRVAADPVRLSGFSLCSARNPAPGGTPRIDRSAIGRQPARTLVRAVENVAAGSTPPPGSGANGSEVDGQVDGKLAQRGRVMGYMRTQPTKFCALLPM
jgi:hypothetical protein